MDNKTVILVMGLSGSGKTTFCKNIIPLLSEHLYLNADSVREEFSDWDFSIEGRMRQAKRMVEIASKVDNKIILIDMICPLKEMREIIKPDIIFFIDRIKESRFKDTDSIFQIPTKDECKTFYIISKSE